MTLATLLLAAASGEPFDLHDKLIVGSTVIVVFVLILLGVFARGQIGIVPRGIGAAFEHVFDWIDGMCRDMIGSAGRQYVPFLMSLFLFVLMSNWSGLLPLPVFSLHQEHHVADVHHADSADGESEEHHAPHLAYEAPTVSFNTTLALAVISFFAFNLYGLKKKIFPSSQGHAHDHEGDEHHHHSSGGLAGLWDWIAHFWQPTPMLANSLEGPMKLLVIPLFFLFLCLNIVEEVARILSLSIRLFGNISGEHQVKVNLLGVLGTFLNNSLTMFKTGSLLGGPGYLALAGLIWGASIFATCLGALAGFIQAMVFMILSLVYIAHAVADDH
ncbi:MAG: F0F1 ATP synthase subunit A [Vulcanimicrobiota bacterium]